MSRRKKELQTERYSLHDCEVRTVTKADKWCQRKLTRTRQVPVGEAPWGYIVTIPYCPNKNTFLEDVDGYIVRSKKHCGKLLLQVVEKCDAPEYGVKSFAREEPNAKKRKRKDTKRFGRILNIKNFHKSEGKW